MAEGEDPNIARAIARFVSHAAPTAQVGVRRELLDFSNVPVGRLVQDNGPPNEGIENNENSSSTHHSVDVDQVDAVAADKEADDGAVNEGTQEAEAGPPERPTGEAAGAATKSNRFSHAKKHLIAGPELHVDAAKSSY